MALINLRAWRRVGFTLAELLAAVLVISIIMVALAPVITRRMQDNISIEVNKKKGLEIFTNPGIYTFDVPVGINTIFIQGSGGAGGGGGATYVDKTVNFTSSTTWTVPGGVNQITFTITGSGGGGGAGNGKSTGRNACGDDGKADLATYPEFLAIRGADDESDLCVFKKNATDGGIWPYANNDTTFLDAGSENKTCTSSYCCWYNTNAAPYNTDASCTSPAGIYSGCNRAMCTFPSAKRVCDSYGRKVNSGPTWGYRLPTEAEVKKWVKYIDTWSRQAGSGGLQFCSHNYLTSEPDFVPQCSGSRLCLGNSYDNRCETRRTWTNESNKVMHWTSLNNVGIEYNQTDDRAAGSVRCVKTLKRYNNYSGSGGASGAQMEKTINVLPSDVLEITIGVGGNGGSYGNSVNNGIETRTGNGSQGGTTQITHKRGAAVLGTYKVLGGFGGSGATVSANGTAIINGSANGQTTPSGTCWAQSRKDLLSAYTGGNTACTTLSYSGGAGTSTAGGSGGRVKDTGSAAAGGTIFVDSTRGASQRNTAAEADYAKGRAAAINGFGGGGGLTPAWAGSSSNFYQGGKGASGKIDIIYRVTLPGGGGGSAARVGGSKTESGADKPYEIAYKIKEGSRIVFKIGSGGAGGVAGQDGLNGEPTVIGDNEIIFLGGQGGKTSTASQKNTLTGGSGGKSAIVDENGNLLGSNTLGLTVKNPSKITYTIAPPLNSFIGEDGYRGQLKNSSNTFSDYGFDGGLGGAPFGISDSFLNSARSCGGGTKNEVNTDKPCPNNTSDGSRGIAHDPVNNQLGGSGGGGGGAVADSLILGQGGSGASGYIRIRWDEGEQE